MGLSTGTKQSPKEEFRLHTAKLITRAARDCVQFYARRTSKKEEKNIIIEYTKTNYEIFERLLEDIYEYVLVEHRKVRNFQYLCKGYLKSSKFKLRSRASKSYVPRMTNMIVELYFKSVKYGTL